MKKIFFAAILALHMPVFAGNDDQEMVHIPAGDFIMGTNDSHSDADGNSDTEGEQPAHKVYLDSYEIDKYEVTVEEYLRCVAAKKCSAIPKGDLKFYAAKEPARMVSWYDAHNFCRWAGKRLPTEAEWEKAARGTSNFINPWGNRPVENEIDSAVGGGFGVVGLHQNDKTDYGVYDMAGNVSEWVSDWYTFDYRSSGSHNPQGPKIGETSQYLSKPMRTARGASYQTNIKGDFRESYFSLSRYGVEPAVGTPTIGFRCAKSIGSDSTDPH